MIHHVQKNIIKRLRYTAIQVFKNIEALKQFLTEIKIVSFKQFLFSNSIASPLHLLLLQICTKAFVFRFS